MLEILTDYAVPSGVFLLMLVAGTEVRLTDFLRLRSATRTVLAGSLGQLVALPPLVLLIHVIAPTPPSIALGMLLLALCPGGGISNYYCYLARCNVLLSATITAVGTLLALITIPLWLALLAALSNAAIAFAEVPAVTVLAQLVMLMVLPMGFGILVRWAFPDEIEKLGKPLRSVSIGIVTVILGAVVMTVAGELSGLLIEIAVSATLFVVGAMLVGWGLGFGLSERDRAVLVMEAGVRNIGVALILGRAMLSQDAFGVFVSFLAGYFIIEIAIMLIYTRHKAARIEG